jgi:hypothetical protein
MLQELTSRTAADWATVSLLFFVAVYVFVSIRLFRKPGEELDAQARRALDDGDVAHAGNPERGRRS